MITNENILVAIRAFSNHQKKKIMKTFTPTRQFPKLLLLNSLAKFLIERKYLMLILTFVRQKYL